MGVKIGHLKMSAAFRLSITKEKEKVNNIYKNLQYVQNQFYIQYNAKYMYVLSYYSGSFWDVIKMYLM